MGTEEQAGPEGDGRGAEAPEAPPDCLGRLGSALLRGLYASWRVRVEGAAVLDERAAAGEPWLLAVWHGKLLTCLPHFGRYGPFTMISQSRDGDRISAVAGALGVVPVRGSTSRGGSRALLQAVRLLRSGHPGAHIVDGPRGPAQHIKPGLLLMAQRSGAPIVPLYAGSSRRWVAERSWDRMEVPLPFSRVLYRLGPPRGISRDADAPLLEQLRAELEQEMREAQDQVDRDARS